VGNFPRKLQFFSLNKNLLKMDALYRREKVPERDELKNDLLGETDPMNAYFVKKEMEIKWKTEDGRSIFLIKQFKWFIFSLSDLQRTDPAKSLWNQTGISLGRHRQIKRIREATCLACQYAKRGDR
jgi:hypothetical protein